MPPEDKSRFTHVSPRNLPTMVNISEKQVTSRVATARAIVVFPEDSGVDLFGPELATKKGPVFSTAIIAGTMGAKKTSELIPFCHSLSLDSCEFQMTPLDSYRLEILCTVRTRGPTGVEMEAITGVSVAAVTVYDMCKAASHGIVIEKICLVEKTGGKTDYVG